MFLLVRLLDVISPLLTTDGTIITGKDKPYKERKQTLEGPCGFCIRNDEAAFITDAELDPRFKAYYSRIGNDGVVSMLCLPIKDGEGEIRGVIQVGNKVGGGNFDKGDLERLVFLGSYALVAVEHCELLTKAQNIASDTVRVLSETDIEGAKSLLAKRACELTAATHASVWLPDDSGDFLSGTVLNHREKLQQEVSFRVGSYPMGSVALSGRSAKLEIGRALTEMDAALGTQTRNMLCVPIKDEGGSVIAVLSCVNKRSGSFSRQEERALEVLLLSARVAIRNALQIDVLEQNRIKLLGLLGLNAQLCGVMTPKACWAALVEKATVAMPSEAVMVIEADKGASELVVHSAGAAERRFPLRAGVSGEVVASGEMFVTEDIDNEPRFLVRCDAPNGAATRSLMVVPILEPTFEDGSGGACVGAIAWSNRIGSCPSYSPADVEIAQLFASLASLCVCNSRALMVEKVLSRGADSTVLKCKTLLEAARSIVLAPSVDELNNIVTKRSMDLTFAGRSSAFLYDRSQNELRFLGAGGDPLPLSGIVGSVVASNRPVIVPNVSADDRFDPAVDERPGFKAANILAVPMLDSSGKCCGALEAANRLNGTFTETDETLLKALAALTAAALERIKFIETESSLGDVLRLVSSQKSVAGILQVFASCLLLQRLASHHLLQALEQSAASTLKASFVRSFMVDVRGLENLMF